MKIKVLSPRKTHEQNPECPMRLVPDPAGGWYCADCGAYLVCESIDTELQPRRPEESSDGLEALRQLTPQSFLYQVSREQAPTYSIGEVKPMAIGNARAVRPELSFENFCKMVQAVAPEDHYNMGSPVDGFDREMSYCCDSGPSTSDARTPYPRPGVLCAQTLTATGSLGIGTTAPGSVLARQMANDQEFVAKTEEGWKAIDQGRSHRLTLSQLATMCRYK